MTSKPDRLSDPVGGTKVGAAIPEPTPEWLRWSLLTVGLLTSSVVAAQETPPSAPIASGNLLMWIVASLGGVVAGPLAAFLGRVMAMGSALGFSPMFFVVGLLAPGLLLYGVLPIWTAGADVAYIACAGISYMATRALAKRRRL